MGPLYLPLSLVKMFRLFLNFPLIWLCPCVPAAKPHDFFDVQTMDAIRHRAICLNLATHIESGGNGHSVVFHSTVCALPLYVF